MHDGLTHLMTVFLGFFAMMNPIANTAIFVSLTEDYDRRRQAAIASRSLLIAFLVVVTFALLGKSLFQLFGITLPAMRIAGGILVFMIGYHMLHGEGSSLHGEGNRGDADIAISPLAVPLLAGPGTIATAMNFSAAGGWKEISATVLSFAVLCLLTFLAFVFGQRLVALIGSSGLSIVTRLMGLILTIIGVQMAITGALEIGPQLH